ncbi:MAG: MnhB domain-containing protein, partial [Acidilobaceae archaeon]
ASFRFLKLKSGKEREVELSVLSKISVKIVSAITIVVAIALLLSDHLPGGGFQSGVTLAIAPAILMAAFSGLYFRRLGFKEWRLAAGLTLGVLGLALVALAPIALGGAALQNQAKPWLEFGGFRIDFFFVSIDKSIKIYDVLEAVVTASGFSLAFLLLLAPEEVYSGIRRRLRWSPGRV